MTEASGTYSATILGSALTVAGLEYYIQASDGVNMATSPTDSTIRVP